MGEVKEEVKLTACVFELRAGEGVELWPIDALCADSKLIIRACSVPFPDLPIRKETGSRDLVESFVIAAMEKQKAEWQWVSLAPATKAAFGDMICDYDCPRDTWMEVRLYTSEDCNEQ